MVLVQWAAARVEQAAAQVERAAVQVVPLVARAARGAQAVQASEGLAQRLRPVALVGPL